MCRPRTDTIFQVLKFLNEEERIAFIKKLEGILKPKEKKLSQHEESERTVYQKAITKEKSQEMLADFFKNIFAEV